MFASNALPPPTSFGHEHRPLRLTSESARPQPHGGCHFQHPSLQHQRCHCQTYQHNRGAPGNICDCGHSACYHSQNFNERGVSPDRIVSALVEKVKKLEDLLIKERESRNSLISRERQAWEREIRVLREALAPFYQTESDMKRRIIHLEDKFDTTLNEHSRLKERVVAIDDASMTLERRVENFELSRSRKRKASLDLEGNSIMSPDSDYTASLSSASDATSVTTQRSPQPPSPPNPPLPASTATTYPRSSGVLNLTSVSRHGFGQQIQDGQHRQQLPSPEDEPRSSGFLSIDLAERLRYRNMNTSKSMEQNPPVQSRIHHYSSHDQTSGLPSPPHHHVSSGALPVSGLLSDAIRSDSESRSTKKRKQHLGGMTGLELLATAASPLAQ